MTVGCVAPTFAKPIMLDRLETVPWHDTYGAYGSVPEMPDRMRALLSPDRGVADEALRWIQNQLLHQGTIWQATAVAVPFLFEIVEQPTVHHREELLWLLISMLPDDEAPLMPEGIDPEARFADVVALPNDSAAQLELLRDDRWELLDDSATTTRWEYDAYKAVERRAEHLIRLVSDAQPAVRMVAARAFWWLPSVAGRAAPHIRAAAMREQDCYVLGSAILSLGLVDRYAGVTGDVPWLTEKLSGEQPLIVRRCASLSIGTLMGSNLPQEALDLLIDATADQATVIADSERMCWRGCSFLGYFWRVLHSLGL